jgi:DNA-binding NtrC family response regulator
MEYPIIGKSKATEQLMKTVHRLAKTRKDVLIVGEAGVGKGAIAKNIFSLSKPDDKEIPFLALNLSVIDDKELEALLFGYDRGVDGLPSTTKRGAFEIAHGGTILIEEIEEASLRNQMKILSFINERKTKRLGGAKNIPIDIRLIITMKEDAEELAQRRKLLEELRDKLIDFEKVFIPPLRERQDDIPSLVKHFTNDLCEELGLPDIAVDVNSIEVLVQQPWRENIRELKAVVDKCVLFSNGGKFTLPPELVDEKTEVVKMLNNINSGQEFVLDYSLDVIEKGIIERSLDRFGFNQSRAAQFLGMTEQTLRYKLKRLGILSSRQRR